MRTILRNASLVVAALSLAVLPLDAQSRGGSSSSSRGGSSSSSGMSRGGSSSSHSYSSSPSRSSSSYSSSPSRSSSYSSSPSRSSSYSSSSSRSSSYSSQQRSSSYQTPSRSGSVTSKGLGTTPSSSSRSTVSQPQQRSGSSYSSAGRGSSSVAPGRSSSSSAPSRSGSSYSSPSRGGSSYSSPSRSGQSHAVRQSNGGVNPRGGNTPGNRPQSVRPRPGERPSNFYGSGPDRVRLDPGRNVERIHPRHHEPMPFNRPCRFWDHGHHYFGYRVTYLPHRYVCHHYHGIPYYLCDGIWYRYWGSSYYVCRPPFGYCFDPIAADIVLSTCRFAYYVDTYHAFSVMNENAQEIAAQNATIAANNALIAQQNATIAMNSERAQAAYTTANNLGAVQSFADASTEYFYRDGVFYVKGTDGQYTVVVPPAGALVNELPSDYDEVTIDGVQYYKVDDTLYRMTIVDGTACFEVVGQLTGELAEKYNLNK